MAKIYLSWNNLQEVFLLPVNPAQLEIGISGDRKSFDLNNIGEVDMLLGTKPAELVIDSIFPGQPYHFCTVPNPLKPKEYIDTIIKWWESKRPIRVTISENGYPISWAMSISDFKFKESAGTDDMEFSLKLKKYQFYGASITEIVKQTNSGKTNKTNVPSRPVEKPKPKQYIVKKGDTLWSICKKELGSTTNIEKVKAYNKIKPDSVLTVGQVITFPAGV